jgi:hypothetical protein
LSFEARHIRHVTAGSGFYEHEAGLRFARTQQLCKRFRRMNRRHDGAPALLHRGNHRAVPTVLAAAFLDRSDGHIGATAREWLDCSHTEHDRIANHAVHLVALQERLGERNGDTRLRCR